MQGLKNLTPCDHFLMYTYATHIQRAYNKFFFFRCVECEDNLHQIDRLNDDKVLFYCLMCCIRSCLIAHSKIRSGKELEDTLFGNRASIRLQIRRVDTGINIITPDVLCNYLLYSFFFIYIYSFIHSYNNTRIFFIYLYTFWLIRQSKKIKK
jgi:hypothetical protein